ncbi:8077_t:CDS:2 [Rhizophagus irregularis]|nr:8077_t:CDS:2 [Rhizophagus irregularis]
MVRSNITEHGGVRGFDTSLYGPSQFNLFPSTPLLPSPNQIKLFPSTTHPLPSSLLSLLSPEMISSLDFTCI